MWQGENKMKITTGKQLALSVIEPLFLGQSLAFWAMPIPTRVLGYPLETTLVALFDVPSEFGGTAHFNMMHGLFLFI